jgi:hypothetical protein
MLLLYVVSYPVLMIRGFPARKNGVVAFPSTCRFSSPGDPVGPLSIFTGRVTIWNYVFYPVDWTLDKVTGTTPNQPQRVKPAVPVPRADE